MSSPKRWGLSLFKKKKKEEVMLAPPMCLKQGKEDKVYAVCHGAFQATKVEGSAADATSRVASLT